MDVLRVLRLLTFAVVEKFLCEDRYVEHRPVFSLRVFLFMCRGTKRNGHQGKKGVMFRPNRPATERSRSFLWTVER